MKQNNITSWPEMDQSDLVSDRRSHPIIDKLLGEIETLVNTFNTWENSQIGRSGDMAEKIKELRVKLYYTNNAIDKRLKDIAQLCMENRIPLFVPIVYDYFAYQATNTIAPAYIMYSLKRKTLVVIDYTLEEWADPEAFLADFEDGYLEKGFYVDPELGVGKVSRKDNIVKIGDFVTLYETPDTVWEYITHLQNLLNVNRIAINTEKV